MGNKFVTFCSKCDDTGIIPLMEEHVSGFNYERVYACDCKAGHDINDVRHYEKTVGADGKEHTVVTIVKPFSFYSEKFGLDKLLYMDFIKLNEDKRFAYLNDKFKGKIPVYAGKDKVSAGGDHE